MEPRISKQAYKGKLNKDNINAYVFDAKESPTSYPKVYVMFEDLNQTIQIETVSTEIDKMIINFKEGTLVNVSENELQTTYKDMLYKFINDNELDLDEPQTSSTTLEDLIVQACEKQKTKTTKR